MPAARNYSQVLESVGYKALVHVAPPTNVLTSPTADELVNANPELGGNGGGDVVKVGTPVDNQVGVWTGDGTLEGDAGLTWNGTTLSVTGGATGTTLALGGATIGSNALAVTGTGFISGTMTLGDGAGATAILASNLSGATDPTITFGNATVTVSSPLLNAAGAAATPSISFSGDTNTGFFSRAGDFISIAMGGTERMTLGYSATGTAGVLVASTSAIGFNSGADTASGGFSDANSALFTRDGAAAIQMGNDAAGVINQMFKGPDRITSDGVGGNLTIAGGRNRGASAGGSLIFQTSPAAGAGVTGTLTTRVTIDENGIATFAVPPKLPGYTVATLPATAATGAVVGAHAYVTDATAPTYLGALTGGGAVVCPVFYDGTAWVSH